MNSIDKYTRHHSRLSKDLCDLIDLEQLFPLLNTQADLINGDIKMLALEKISAFSMTANPRILPELLLHIEETTQDFLHCLRETKYGDFSFVKRYAKSQAEQFFPLEASLVLYRLSAKVYGNYLQETSKQLLNTDTLTPEISYSILESVTDYCDTLCTTNTSQYVTHTRLHADVFGDQRAELLRLLLGGFDESDARIAKLLRDSGFLDKRMSFCVVLAQSNDAGEMQNPERARRLLNYIDKTLSEIPGQRLLDIHRSKVTIIFSHVRRLSGWTAPQASLAQKVKTTLLKVGNAVRIGISNDAPSTANIPVAYREAALAFELSDLANRVVKFADIPLQQLLIHLAGEDFHRILPPWSKAFFAANTKSNNALAKTLKTYAQTNMNILKTAAILSIHPNTVYARLEKIQDITGLDARNFQCLSELLLVIDCEMQFDLR